jgi:peptidyl-prolyl cis-trans isomerase SurA
MIGILLLASVVIAGQGAVFVDRVAVIVGKRVIKSSDIDRDLRLTSFINRQEIDSSAAARRKAAARLVDQQIIREELSAQGYSRASDADADELMKDITKQRFKGSDAQLRVTLARYGVTKDQLHEQLLWQLTVLRFIDQRFRPGVLVTDEEVRSYYDQHLADLKRESPNANSFEAISGKIKASLEGERVDKEFEAWLDEARKRNRIDYKEAAFQ